MLTKDLKKGKLNMRIPLLDLKAQYRALKREIDGAIKKIIDEQNFIMGEDIRFFEKEMAQYCNVKFAIGVSSGTDALIMALKAIGIEKGDEVITTPFTFIATAGAISNAGGKPVFCDIDPDTYNIDPDKLEKCITRRTKAIIPVHLYGQCANMDRVMKIADANKLMVIEDAAQAIGASYKGRKAGSMGDIGCISFFPSKNLGAFGDGGMVIMNSKKLAKVCASWRVHGTSERRYIHDTIGTNARLDNIQAAILRVKLKSLDSWIEKRQENAGIYSRLFKGTSIIPPSVAPGCTHVYHQYSIKVPALKRDPLIDHLSGLNIESRVYYPVPLHLQECFRTLNYKKGDFPHAEEASRSTLAIPVYPELSGENLSYIAKAITAYIS